MVVNFSCTTDKICVKNILIIKKSNQKIQNQNKLCFISECKTPKN